LVVVIVVVVDLYTYFLLQNYELHPPRQPLLTLLTTLRDMVKFYHDAAILIQVSICQEQLLHPALSDPTGTHTVQFLLDKMQTVCSPTKKKVTEIQILNDFNSMP